MPSYTSNSSHHYPLPVWQSIAIGKVCSLIILFGLLWFAGDRFGGWCLQRLSDSSQFRFSKMYAGNSNSDYVVFGNSRGVNSFYVPGINQITGLDGLNLSYNDMPVMLMETLFSDYLDQNITPNFVLIEITNLNSKSSNLISNFKPYIGESKGLSDSFYRHFPVAFIASSLSHLYRYNNEMFLRVLYYVNKSDQSWINRYKMDSSFLEIYNPQDFGHYSYGLPVEENLESLRRMIALAESKGVEVFLIVGPYLPAHVKQLEGYGDWLSIVRTSLDRPIFDFSQSIDDGPSFADPLHLNIDGAREFNSILSETILSHEHSSSGQK